jgi:hypothetical protein
MKLGPTRATWSVMLDVRNFDTSPKRQRGISIPSLALRACIKPNRAKYNAMGLNRGFEP